jgi:hypothetical protein
MTNPTCPTCDMVSQAPDHCVECETEFEAPSPAYYTVAIYLCDRAYGGAEEGGWYYDCGELAKDFDFISRRKVFRTSGEAYAYASRLNRGEFLQHHNDGRPSIGSVLSQGRYRAEVFANDAPGHFPAERPYYS